MALVTVSLALPVSIATPAAAELRCGSEKSFCRHTYYACLEADSRINNGDGASYEVQTPRGHTSNTVVALGWVAFDVRCRDVPPCLGYHSAYPDVSWSPGIDS